MSDVVNKENETQLSDFHRMMKADLHPDLVPYVTDGPMGKMLHHPLAIEIMMIPGMHGHTNTRYERKKQALTGAMNAKDWGKYIFIHERPYRAGALRDLIDEEHFDLRVQRNWRIVSEVWTDSENVQEYDEFWNEMWSHPHAHKAMTTAERKAFDALPKLIPVWHGLEREDEEELGFSWTTSEKTGVWFAHRFARLKGRGAYLAKGFVKKSDARVYLLGRNEFEIIAFPNDVKDVKITRVRS